VVEKAIDLIRWWLVARFLGYCMRGKMHVDMTVDAARVGACATCSPESFAVSPHAVKSSSRFALQAPVTIAVYPPPDGRGSDLNRHA
jgi:hypothetical protein